MNLVDAFLLVALAWVAFRGYRQGALSQIASFGGAWLGLVAGAVAAPRLSALLVGQPSSTLALITLALLVVSIFVGQAVGLAVGLSLRRVALRIGIGLLDRTAGILVGVVGLLLAVWMLGAVLVQGPSEAIARGLRESRVVAAVDEALPPPPDLFSRVGAFLDEHGFPQVFAGLGGGTLAPPVPPPEQATVAAAVAAGGESTVQVQATGCGGIASGSGAVVRSGFIVTNAHVVAGATQVIVRDRAGEHAAVPILFDPDVDLAVLASPETTAPPIPFASERIDRGATGAVLGFPGGQRTLDVQPAGVRGRQAAVGRDIYGQGLVTREILTLDATVRQGNSGGPFVTARGEVGGVVFAAATSQRGVGYALTVEQVRPAVDAAMSRNQAVATGRCRFAA